MFSVQSQSRSTLEIPLHLRRGCDPDEEWPILKGTYTVPSEPPRPLGKISNDDAIGYSREGLCKDDKVFIFCQLFGLTCQKKAVYVQGIRI
jgi:hypothetical protein